MLRLLARTLGALLLAFFVLAQPFSLALRDVGALVFDADTTKTLVREHLLDSELIAGLAARATQGLFLGEEGETSITGALVANTLSQLSEEDWQRITELTAPADLVEDTVDEIVNGYTDWLDGDAPIPQFELDLSAWKANTQANAAPVLAVVLDALPECSSEQMANMAVGALRSFESLLGTISGCRPGEPLYGMLMENADLLLQATLSRAPDSIDLNVLSQDVEAPEELVAVKQNLGRVRSLLNYGWLLPAAAGVLGVALGGRGKIGLLRWAGWPLLLAGGITFVLGLGLQVFSLHFLDNLLARPLVGGAGAVGLLGSAIAGGALDLVSRPLLLQGFVMLLLGGGSLYAVHVMARRLASPGIPLNKTKIGW